VWVSVSYGDALAFPRPSSRLRHAFCGDRGVTGVVTETDVRNGGSHPMASRLGTSTGVMTEWERSP